MKKKVIFLGMGGTIGGLASSADDNIGYKAAQVGIGALLNAIPPLMGVLQGRDVGYEQVAQLDSKDLDFSDCATLSRRVAYYLGQDEVCAVIITHGTDTLEEEAFFLHETLTPELLRHKPVVLTCAMRPASSLYPDGPQNILDATSLVMTPGVCGVLVVCSGVVYQGDEVQKTHPYRVNAFDAGEASPVGYVEEGRVRQVRPWPSPSALTSRCASALIATKSWPRVEIVMNYVGANGATVRALCTPVANEARVEGIVVAATGNGTIHHSLLSELRAAAEQGICILRSTRCTHGQIIVAQGVSQDFPVARNANPIKARIALTLDLAKKRPPDSVA